MDFSLQDDPCEFAGCQRLDFRPFRCAKCAGTFCLDHRAANGHNCPAQFHVYRGRADFELYGPSAPALYRRAETHATARTGAVTDARAGCAFSATSAKLM
eukprot:Polyplicarium_translucidae@DN2602_c1_g1_i4.p5